MAGIAEYWQNYIDGAFVDGGAGRIDVLDPGSGEVLCQHALADERDVDRAVASARGCVRARHRCGSDGSRGTR